MMSYTLLRKSTAIAYRALLRNKLQTILTMVGMTIGVATVLTMVALGSGAQAAIQDQVRAAGMNIIVVTAGNYKMQQQWTSQGEAEEPAAYHPSSGPPVGHTAEWHGTQVPSLERINLPGDNPIQELERGGHNAAGRGGADTLTLEDADAVEKLRGVQYVSGCVAENATVAFESTTWFTRLHGEGANLPFIRRAWVLAHGRFFTKDELKRSEDVVVLGNIVSDKLFGATIPVGRSVLIKGQNFRIVGVISSGSWMVPAAAGDDQFDAIYIPVTAAETLLGRKSLNTLTISTSSTGDVTRASKSITTLLRGRHGIKPEQPEDFIVAGQAHKTLAKGGMRTDIARAVTGNVTNLDKVTLDQLGKTLDRASRTMTALLASIATVSLIVGGIGIMNIMLLSVTERTREIGIRRAVGARSDEVMLQFLMEAVTLSLSGGVMGIVLGVTASGSITNAIQWSTRISPLAIVLSFGVSAVVGILFGYYPAREASRVSPMTSLRYE